MRVRIFLATSLAIAAVAAVSLAADSPASPPAPKGMVEPQYNEKNQLIRPENYRTWIFVGSSLGLSYTDPQANAGPGTFHHIYMQPEAYKQYKETGEFPEKTMLVMENYSAGSKEENTAKELTKNKEEFEKLNGHFEDSRTGVEVALKDSARFPDKWAYFNFSRADGLVPVTTAFSKQACWECHNTHGAVDNVFVQFYPVLREAREEKKK